MASPQPPKLASQPSKPLGCLGELFGELLSSLIAIPVGGLLGMAMVAVVLGTLWLVGYTVFVTWPVCAFLAAAAIGWRIARKRSGPFAKAASDVLPPIALGLLVLCIALIVLDVSRDRYSASWPERVEDGLVRWALRLREHLELSLPMLIGIMIVLLVINHYWPRLRVVTRFLTLQQIGSKLTLALIAITSFTLAAHGTVETWAHKKQDTLQERYRASLRQIKKDQAQIRTATALEAALPRMSPLQIQAYRSLYKEVHYRGSAEVRVILDRITAQNVASARQSPELAAYIEKIPKEPDFDSEEETLLSPPKSEQELLAQENIAHVKEQAAQDVKLRAAQAKEGLRSVFVAIAGAGLPSFGDFADAYLDSLLDAWSEVIVEKLGNGREKELPDLQARDAHRLIQLEDTSSLSDITPREAMRQRVAGIDETIKQEKRLEEARQQAERVQREIREREIRMRERAVEIR
jgi:hypothetical protein